MCEIPDRRDYLLRARTRKIFTLHHLECTEGSVVIRGCGKSQRATGAGWGGCRHWNPVDLDRRHRATPKPHPASRSTEPELDSCCTGRNGSLMLQSCDPDTWASDGVLRNPHQGRTNHPTSFKSPGTHELQLSMAWRGKYGRGIVTEKEPGQPV